MLEALKKRRAIRNFESREVELDKIETLLEAATYAPNDRMREPWHFYVLQGDSLKRYEQVALDYLNKRFPTKPHLVESSMKAITNTPLVIVVTSAIVEGDEGATKDNVFAVSSSIMSIWLMAEQLGLGMVWRTRGVGLVHDTALHDFIGASDQEQLVGTLCIGYPAEEITSEKKRSPFAEKTTWL
ncbi:cobalamin biosynthesis protein CbiY [Sporosarcina globispora]|uniref:Cobalamin biosynthesis protein CbiY n=1 Tax=Sporosarcina globispora TaxID=1459 RepID=A0A0M0GDU8_SPOGL|nr:nitroreductase [Sporosarcina globispora]KON88090.1 cobalamin biosynthesis protein CbiY [Sporosarcina globispora]